VSRPDEPHDVVEIIYREVDALLRAGSFSQVDDLIQGVDPRAWSVVSLLAFVSITRDARDHLRERGDLVERVRSHLEGIEGARAEELLAGLE
jgi:hypothetical protein